MKISRKDIIAKVRAQPCRKFPIDIAGLKCTLLVRRIALDRGNEFKPELIEIGSTVEAIEKFNTSEEAFSAICEPEVEADSLIAVCARYKNLHIIHTEFAGVKCYSLWHKYHPSEDKELLIYKPVYLLWQPEFLEISNAMEKLEALL